MATTQDIDAAEEERRKEEAERSRTMMRLRYQNRLLVWSKLLEALSIKMDVPDEYETHEYLMDSLRQSMEKVSRVLAK